MFKLKNKKIKKIKIKIRIIILEYIKVLIGC